MKLMRLFKISQLSLLLFFSLISLSMGRKTFLVKEFNKQVYSPRVSAYDGSICIWRTTEDRLCVDHNTQVEAGVKYTQARDLTNLLWKLRGIAYVSTDLTIHPELLLKMIYYNEVTATIDKFETYAFGEILWTDSYLFCHNLGWGTEKIVMAIDTAMSFKDCYKHFIETFANLDTWLGLNAKIPDECLDS